MKMRWWMMGLIAVAVGGAVLLLRRSRKGENGVFHFVENEEALKNFGAFPPDIPETEFDGVNFLY